MASRDGTVYPHATCSALELKPSVTATYSIVHNGVHPFIKGRSLWRSQLMRHIEVGEVDSEVFFAIRVVQNKPR